MKDVIIVLSSFLVIVSPICIYGTLALAQPVDYDRVGEKTMCQYDKFICQWDIVDSNMGVVTYKFTELPPYTIVDANIGRVEFTPQETGEFYIKVIATCSGDPNACLWPEERREEVKIAVNPSTVWKLRLVVSSE